MPALSGGGGALKNPLSICLCMYMCTRTYIWTNIYIYMHMYMYMYMYMYTCVYIIYGRILNMYMCMYTSTYIYYVYVYAPCVNLKGHGFGLVRIRSALIPGSFGISRAPTDPAGGHKRDLPKIGGALALGAAAHHVSVVAAWQTDLIPTVSRIM